MSEINRKSGLTSTFDRSKLAAQMDDFCTFTWRGKNMWEEFGAFIINDKGGSLKFYNGPNYTNEYSKPQFAKNTQLLGVNFNTQQIGFKVGVYGVTEHEYRQLMHWLDPYKMGDLIFSFEQDWKYVCKLTGCQDSTRYIIGRSNNAPVYYTELNLKFELQGPQCAISTIEHSLESAPYQLDVTSDIGFPIVATFIIPSSTTAAEFGLSLGEKSLFNISIDEKPEEDLEIQYDSEKGLLYYKDGNSYRLLSLLNIDKGGRRIISSIEVNKFLIAGTFEMAEPTSTFTPTNLNDLIITWHDRTNLI